MPAAPLASTSHNWRFMLSNVSRKLVQLITFSCYF
jgi:hypothetical protein